MFSILIVDDNKFDREGIKGLIDWESLGIEVVGMAVDGLDGYKQAIGLKPDFILADVSMPVMDGIKMTQKIKAELPQTKFIFMSCFDDFEYLKGAIDLEVYGYILKPINLNELTDAIIKVKSIKQAELEKKQNEDELIKQLNESKPVLQEQFIRDLLYGKLNDEKDIRDRMKYIGIDFSGKLYSVLFLEIDNYDLHYSGISIEERQLLLYRIQKCIKETLLCEMSGFVTNHQYNSLIVVILVPEESTDAFDSIIDMAHNCRNLVNSEVNTEITIGISELSAHLKELPRLFETAEYTVKSKFYSGGNRIILASEVKQPEAGFKFNIAEIRQELDAILENGKDSDISGFINKWYNEGLCYPETYIKSLSYAIITVIQTIMLERNECSDSFFEDSLTAWDKLTRTETIADIKEWLYGIISKVRKSLAQKENTRYNKVVEDIKSIIDENYAEIENVGQIVDRLYISASHANFIFKQQTGQTIFDYLLHKRMEEAKKLLMDPYIKIYEVAEKTGYKTNSYFASVFKDYTGLTPKQFRDKYSI